MNFDRRSFLKIFLGGIGTFIAGVAYAVGYGPMQRPNVTRYKLTPENWPKDINLKIAVIADIHACDPWMSLDRIRSIVEQTNKLNPDLTVLLGDYTAGMKRWRLGEIPSSEWAAELALLKAPLGVHAILGNHDWWDDREAQRRQGGPTVAQRALEAVGIPVYSNRAVRLAHQGRGFWLAGLEDQLAMLNRTAPAGKRVTGLDDLPGLLQQIATEDPIILIAHEPDIIPSIPERVCLTLCGHTHGGQVNLFGWRPASASRGSKKFPYGHFQIGKRDVVVSGGLGCSILPIRVGVPPEIVMVEMGA
ncbi:metallophosphoesterase [Rhabdaerophilum sp.]|uniref:metallophosphoesterase n=1 Tax=Rhabdaerophilum sp. TaxID=2717341 RepID=UPI0038D4515F